MTDVSPSPNPPAVMAAQGSSVGRALHVARVATNDGQLLLPYGDYGTNTGPIHVLAYNPAVPDTVSDYATVPDEQLIDYRKFSYNGVDVLFTLISDPQGRNDAVAYHTPFIETDHSTWSPVTIAVPDKGVAVHLFDIMMMSNGHLYACGARGYTSAEQTSHSALPNYNTDQEYNGAAFVWRSTDFGSTWSEVFVDLKNGDGYYRFYGMGQVGDKLVVAASDGGGYWVINTQGANPTVSAKKSTSFPQPPIYIYGPPINSRDNNSFFAEANANGVWSLDSSDNLTFNTPNYNFNRALSSGPEGWLFVDNDNVLRYGPNYDYGELPDTTFNRGCIISNENGSFNVYVSNGVKIYKLENPTILN